MLYDLLLRYMIYVIILLSTYIYIRYIGNIVYMNNIVFPHWDVPYILYLIYTLYYTMSYVIIY